MRPHRLASYKKPPTGSTEAKDDVAESHSRVRSWATIAAFTLIIALTVAEGVDEGFSFWDWLVIAVGAVFTLARFSEAFLILRAQQLGLPDAFAPLVLVVMNAVYAISAYPLGKLADRVSHRRLLAWGLGLLSPARCHVGIQRAVRDHGDGGRDDGRARNG